MVYLKCPKCGNKWNYKGEKSINASCTDCRHPVNIQKYKIPGGKKC